MYLDAPNQLEMLRLSLFVSRLLFNNRETALPGGRRQGRIVSVWCQSVPLSPCFSRTHLPEVPLISSRARNISWVMAAPRGDKNAIHDNRLRHLWSSLWPRNEAKVADENASQTRDVFSKYGRGAQNNNTGSGPMYNIQNAYYCKYMEKEF